MKEEKHQPPKPPCSLKWLTGAACVWALFIGAALTVWAWRTLLGG